MATFPAAAEISGSITNSAMKASLGEWLATAKQQPGGSTRSNLTITAGGIITPTGGVHSPLPNTGSADDLDNISTSGALPDGALLLLSGTSGNTITLRDAQGGSGQMLLDGGAFDLVVPDDHILLRRDGTDWQEVFRSDDKIPHGKQLFTSSGSFTVPRNVVEIWVTVIGGGGGGGGGSGAASGDGSAGSPGGTTSFDTITVSGGIPGNGGDKTNGVHGAGGNGGLTAGGGPGFTGSPNGKGGNGGSVGLLSSGNFVLGNGGRGGVGASGASFGGGGGESGVMKFEKKTVTPGSVLTVTIGVGEVGGAGTGGGSAGDTGKNGGCLVEW